MKREVLFSVVLLIFIGAAPATRTDDAASIYIAAEKLVKANCPSASAMEYRAFPPYPDEWNRMESAAIEQNQPMFQLVRKARVIQEANWPAGQLHLNACRNIANQFGDAAEFESFRRNDALAVEYIRDLLHMVDLLNAHPRDVLHPLVAAAIQMVAAQRMLIIASDIRITSDPTNTRDLQAKDAQKLIGQLLDFKEPLPLLAEVLGKDKALRGMSIETDRVIEIINRSNADCTFSAVSLACHLYRFENGEWPQNLEALTPKHLAQVPLDTFGDGRETLGFVIIKDGLPEGGDRPMLYSRCLSQDGLFYRVDEPQYVFYDRKPHGGQFRDIARWSPRPDAQVEPTTRPLP